MTRSFKITLGTLVVFLFLVGFLWYSSRPEPEGELVVFTEPSVSQTQDLPDHSSHHPAPIVTPSSETSVTENLPTDEVPATVADQPTDEVTLPGHAPGHKDHVPTSDRPANPVEVTYKGEDGRTASGILRDIRHINFLDTAEGPVLITIDGTTVDPGKGEKWMIYVNGKTVSKPPYLYVTKDSETITWKVVK